MLKKRNLAVTVLIFTIGVGLGIFMKDFDTFCFRAVIYAISVIAALLCLVMRIFKNNKVCSRISAAALAVAAFTFGISRVFLYNMSVEKYKSFDGITDIVEMEITEINNNRLETRIVKSNEGVPKNTILRFYPKNSESDYIIGDIINCEIKYNYKFTNNMLSNDSVLTASGTILNHSHGSGLFYSIRKSVHKNSDNLYKNFRFAKEISRGVTIGDRTDMNDYTYSIYRSAGISHILAISGLHISIITMALYSFLSKFNIDKRIVSAIGGVFALFYAALVGFTPSVTRAVIMLLFVMIMRFLIYSADSITALFSALALILIINPYALYSAGVQLSFLCTLGILLFEPTLGKISWKLLQKYKKRSATVTLFYKILNSIIDSVAISLVSAIFTFPVMFFSFDTFSYASVFVNLIAVPLFSIAIQFCFISLLLAPIWIYLALPFAYISGALFDAISYIAKFIHDIDLGTVSVYLPFVFIPVILSVAVIVSLMLLKEKRTVVCCSLMGAFFVSLICCNLINNIQNQSTALIEYGTDGGEYAYYSYNGSNLYIDLGGYTANTKAVYKSGETSLDNYFMLEYSDYGLKRLDAMSGTIKINNLYVPYPKNDFEADCISKIKELANQRNCDIIYFKDNLSKRINDQAVMQISGIYGNLASETSIYFIVNDIKINILDNGYKNAVYGDVAVLTSQYNGKVSDISATDIYYNNKLANKNLILENDSFTGFENSLRIKINVKEREFNVYEP